MAEYQPLEPVQFSPELEERISELHAHTDAQVELAKAAVWAALPIVEIN